MSEKKYVVPQEMIEYATNVLGEDMRLALRSDTRWPGTISILEAAVKWLAENPIVPTEEDMSSMAGSLHGRGVGLCEASFRRQVILEWQRRMFLAPYLDAPISDLIYLSPAGIPVVLSNSSVSVSDDVNSRIREAFRRGQKVSSK